MGDKGQHLLTFFHERSIIQAGPIPFQEGEFREMPFASFMATVDLADLEKFGVPCCEEAFHA